MLGKTNAGSTGGGLSSNNAILRVSASTGSTVTISRSGVTKTAIVLPNSLNSGKNIYIFTVNASEFSASEWTVTATKSSTVTKTITIDSAKEYTVEIEYGDEYQYDIIEYFETTGTQYINTGIGASSIRRVILNGQTKTISSSATPILGATSNTDLDSAASINMFLYRPDGRFYIGSTAGNYLNIGSIGSNKSFTIDIMLSKSNTTINGYTTNITVNGTTTTQNITGNPGSVGNYSFWLLACNYKGSYLAAQPVRMGAIDQTTQDSVSGAIYANDGSLYHHYLTAKRRSDGVCGFYIDQGSNKVGQFIPLSGSNLSSVTAGNIIRSI